ncbi:MAG: hypothetical protein ACJ0HJ_04835 [Candidatus Pseudothioglobus sp.]
MKKLIKILAKVLIAFLGVWCVCASLAALYGVSLYFPFYITDGVEIPYHRMLALRVTILLTFAYYSLKYLMSESRQLYPIQFLDTILKIYFCSALSYWHKARMLRASEFMVLFLFLLMAIVTHVVSRPKLRRFYYSKFSD